MEHDPDMKQAPSPFTWSVMAASEEWGVDVHAYVRDGEFHLEDWCQAIAARMPTYLLALQVSWLQGQDLSLRRSRIHDILRRELKRRGQTR